MPAVTDITYQQLNNALREQLGLHSDLIAFDANGMPESIDIMLIIESLPLDISNNATGGVIKLMTRLFDGCRQAQNTINEGQSAGERLNTFAAPTAQALAGNLIPIVRTMTTRADFSSADKVVGTNV